MKRIAILMLSAAGGLAQSPARPALDAFEVASIKPTKVCFHCGRTMSMQSTHEFVAKNFTLKLLIGAAYNLTPAAISGGPRWMDSDFYTIVAATPGEARPNRDEQMAMLRNLLAERCKLAFRREAKQLPMYALTVVKGGAKLKESTAPANGQENAINQIFPDHVLLPARNVRIATFVSLLQRVIVDRPVVDRTGLAGRYDFDLEWAPDESEFGGEIPAPKESTKPGFFTALQEQLGLRLKATRGPVETMVIARLERPSEN